MQISGRDLSNFCFNVYDSETWTSRRADERLIDSLEIWLRRRMEGIGWRDGVTPEKVLDRVVEQRSLTKKIWRQKKNWRCHIYYSYGWDNMLRDILEGKMDGKRGG